MKLLSLLGLISLLTAEALVAQDVPVRLASNRAPGHNFEVRTRWQKVTINKAALTQLGFSYHLQPGEGFSGVMDHVFFEQTPGFIVKGMNAEETRRFNVLQKMTTGQLLSLETFIYTLAAMNLAEIIDSPETSGLIGLSRSWARGETLAIPGDGRSFQSELRVNYTPSIVEDKINLVVNLVDLGGLTESGTRATSGTPRRLKLEVRSKDSQKVAFASSTDFYPEAARRDVRANQKYDIMYIVQARLINPETDPWRNK